MPRATHHGRFDRLTFTERLQFLACRIEIRTDIAEFANRLRYLSQHAEQDHIVTDSAEFVISREEGSYVAREDGAVVAAHASGEFVFETLFQRIHQRAVAALPDDIRIHAASGIDRGRMFLLVGDAMAGKTTLALHLLLNGMEMIGDELVMLRNGLAATFPRKFYPRESTFALVPGLERAGTDLPIVFDTHRIKRMAIDPLAFGLPWRIARAPIAAVFYLDPDFSGRSKVNTCSKVDMVQRVMEQCSPPLSQRKGWIGDLCAMVNNATVRRLTVGDLPSAAIAIRENLI